MTKHAAAAEQLALIDPPRELPPADDVPVSLRLSKRTRLVGLRGVAQARALLAAQAARHQEDAAETLAVDPLRAA